LAEPLWREAQLARPVFSERLHARLRAAVRGAAQDGPKSAIDSRRKHRGDRLSWAVVLTASLTLLVGSALFWHAVGPPPSETVVQTNPGEAAQPPADDIDVTTALVESTATGLGQWMKTTVDENQWAGLDRDAQTALATVAGPLPFDLSAAIADGAE
jgi:hypothetical protein